MDIELCEALKESVLRFLQNENGYDADDVEEITIQNTLNGWSILYGATIETGIIGIGDSADNAFDNFVHQWRAYDGFKWIKKTGMLPK